MNDTPRDLFRGWAPVDPPSPVRDRVLAAARRGAVSARPPLGVRLWESRWVRIAWLAATAVLVALNLWLPSPAERGPRTTATAAAPFELDPLLASLMADHPPTRTTWADQGRLLAALLEEAPTVPTDVTADGGHS